MRGSKGGRHWEQRLFVGADGVAAFSLDVLDIPFDEVRGRCFVLKNGAGQRIACGEIYEFGF